MCGVVLVTRGGGDWGARGVTCWEGREWGVWVERGALVEKGGGKAGRKVGGDGGLVGGRAGRSRIELRSTGCRGRGVARRWWLFRAFFAMSSMGRVAEGWGWRVRCVRGGAGVVADYSR